jgi:hypothetical protein
MEKYLIYDEKQHNLFTQKFWIMDIFTDEIKSLFEKSAIYYGAKIKYKAYRKRPEQIESHYDTYTQVLIVTIKNKDGIKLRDILEKFHSDAKLMGYTDFEKITEDFIRTYSDSKQ